MDDLEWGHRSLTELRLVDDMHEHKRTMLELSNAVVALPGGCGTLEELFEAITWKRLGLYRGPVVLVNVNGFYRYRAATAGALRGRAFHATQTRRHVAGGRLPGRSRDPPWRPAPEWPTDARTFAALR